MESTGLARGPAFQLFDTVGNLQLTLFVLNPDFITEISFSLDNLDADPEDEVLVGGIETGGLARGPAYQVFDPDGTLKHTRFVLNPDFTNSSFSIADIASPGVLVCGQETKGLGRGPAFQIFDGSGNFLLTRFALNPDFTELQCLTGDLTGAAGDEIVTGGSETSGLARGPAYQVWDKDGTLLQTTQFVLNGDCREVKFVVADVASDGIKYLIRWPSG